MPDTELVTPDAAAIEAGGLWLSISQLAERKGVSKQALSERIGRLAGEGRLALRPGPRRSKLVNVAQFDRAVGAAGDPAKEAGASLKNDGVSVPTLSPEPAPAGVGTAPSPYRDAAAREKAYRADLAELELAERLGKVVPIADVTDAMVACAKAICGTLDRLPLRAAELVAAATNEGEIGVRRVLRDAVFEQRKALAETMRLAAEGSRLQVPHEGEVESSSAEPELVA